MQQTDENWQEGKVLPQKGKHLLETSLWSDCCFVVGEEGAQQEFKAHKLFLAMASPAFAAMFYGPIAEKGDAIAVEDVTREGFKLLLEYIYTDTVNIENFHEARDVCYVAKKYLMQSLEKICVQKLRDFLNPTTACFTYEFALWIEDKQLTEEARDVISSRTTEVLQDPNIGEVQLSTLDNILDMDRLAITNELELFEAVLVWAKCECTRKGGGEDGESLRAVAGPLLRKVRFLTLRPQQLAQGPAASALLSREESYALLMNVSAPGDCPVPLPRGFSDSTDIRSVTRAISAEMWYSLCTSSDEECCMISFEGRKGMWISGVKVSLYDSASCTVWMWESSGALDERRTLVAEEKYETDDCSDYGDKRTIVVVFFRKEYPVKVHSKYDIMVEMLSMNEDEDSVSGDEDSVSGSIIERDLKPDEFEIFVSEDELIQSVVASWE